MALEEYRRKRRFERTPEPRGRRARRARGEALQFVVQKHAARRLHYDFRLELDGVLKSWAVPRGPSLVPGERRMAVETEDHPLEYADFEGVIPPGEYGGGAVLVWDRGHWMPIGDPREGLARGKLDFRLAGEKLRGRWHLVRMQPRERRARERPAWLLIKGDDAEARTGAAGEVTETEPRSVLSGRTIDEVARDADRVWSGRSGEADPPSVPAPGDPASVPGATRAALPARVAPQLATLVDAPPADDAWLHELKLDGYRLLARVERGEVRLTTRAGHDWTARFPGLADALAALPVETALLDGEAVVLDEQGRSSFQALQRALAGERRAPILLYLFDLLHLDGWDLRGAPLLARKQRLRQLLARAPAGTPLRYTDHLQGRGPDFYAEVCRAGAEGIVSKRADAPYRSGRTRAWLKVKCKRRQEFVVVGYTEPSGSRVALGALLLGAYDADGALRYCGRVGTGFDDATLAALRERLEPLAVRRPPVVDPPRRERGAHWVEPQLVAEVEFAEWTADGRVRHPSYRGLREDKPAAEVRFERPEAGGDGSASASVGGDASTAAKPRGGADASASGKPRGGARRPQGARNGAGAPAPASDPPPPAARRDARSVVAGVRLSNPDRIYFPELGITKRELAGWYEAAAERILPGLARRPLTLLRCPTGREGPCFYQKHANESVPDAVPRVVVRPGEPPYAMVVDLPSLIALVQIGVLELHVWGARADRLDRPDIVVFDLDPDPTVSWRRLVDTAFVLRGYLERLGLVPFVRTTGGKGLHVVVPIARRSTWAQVKGFAQGVAAELVARAPEALTDRLSKQHRHGRIFIDYLRNAPEATAIATWSVRARPGAPVAVPLSWEELDAAPALPRFGLREAPERLALPDPWADFEASARTLTKRILRRVEAREVLP